MFHLVKLLNEKRAHTECLTAYLACACIGLLAAWRIEPTRNRDNILTTISAILENPPFVFAASKYKHGVTAVNRITGEAKGGSSDV